MYVGREGSELASAHPSANIDAAELTVYPNPATENVTLNFVSDQSEKIGITVLTSTYPNWKTGFISYPYKRTGQV